MKRFAFPLERVLDWRRMQARLEEQRAEQLHAELRGIDKSREDLRSERERSAAQIQSARSATGADLAALDRFRRHVDAEQARLGRAHADCRERVAAQMGVRAARNRDVKILEHLRDQRMRAWMAELDREIEQQAAENFLSRWRFRRKDNSTRDG